MAEKNKNTGNTPGGITSKPDEGRQGNPSTDHRDQRGTKSPSHEQGREHMPNMNAQSEGADAHRGAEQAQATTTNTAEKQRSGAGERKNHEAGSAKRTTDEAQSEGQAGEESKKIVAGRDSGGKR